MRKRKSYKRETVESTNTTKNVVSINPYLIQCENRITGQKRIYDVTSLKELKNEGISLYMAGYLQQKCSKSSSIRGYKSSLNLFLSFLTNNNIDNLSQINYETLVKYKYFINDKYDEKTINRTKNGKFAQSFDFLNYVRTLEGLKLSEDVLNGDYPKNFEIKGKSAVEKDLEHNNKSYTDEQFSLYLQKAVEIICNEKSNHHDKVTAFMIVISFASGANGDVILQLTDKDLNLLANDFDYLDLTKHKSRKGVGGAPIKITLKNYNFYDIKLSEMALIIKESKENYRNEFNHEIFKDLLFIYPRLRKGVATSRWSALNANAAPAQVTRLFTRYDTSLETTFTFGKSRKYFERKIQSITGDSTITSSLLGHSRAVANKNYLNTSASIESHQKLALTQDVIEGFSKNDQTDNFVKYQQLLNLFNLDLTKAIELANKDFPIEEVIKNAQKEDV